MQGHVDTIATIISVREDGEAKVVRLRPREKGVLRYVVEKGYVTLDGASLTVTGVSDDVGRDEDEERKDEMGWWEVMLIAYTQEKIVTAGKGVGQEVNVEVDMVGKYVEKSVRGYFEGMEGDGSNAKGGGVLEKMVGRMVDERIRAKG